MPKIKVPVSELPIMGACCKSCPFKQDDKGRQQDTELANKVTERTLFNAQQLCHSTRKGSKPETHRCRGSYDNNFTIYQRLGLAHLIK